VWLVGGRVWSRRVTPGQPEAWQGLEQGALTFLFDAEGRGRLDAGHELGLSKPVCMCMWGEGGVVSRGLG